MQLGRYEKTTMVQAARIVFATPCICGAVGECLPPEWGHGPKTKRPRQSAGEIAEEVETTGQRWLATSDRVSSCKRHAKPQAIESLAVFLWADTQGPKWRLNCTNIRRGVHGFGAFIGHALAIKNKSLQP